MIVSQKQKKMMNSQIIINKNHNKNNQKIKNYQKIYKFKKKLKKIQKNKIKIF